MGRDGEVESEYLDIFTQLPLKLTLVCYDDDDGEVLRKNVPPTPTAPTARDDDEALAVVEPSREPGQGCLRTLARGISRATSCWLDSEEHAG